ncbi:hypothetical protein [Zoogloea sp.]|uniref:hypothetical protein n=1 Tax=Zoogloea sp. TaxID=49181 RepID=UPI0035B30431
MQKNVQGFVDLINTTFSPKAANFVKQIQGVLGQSGETATGEPPGQRFSATLSNYKSDELVAIQRSLEALSSAINLWVGAQGQAVTASIAASADADVPGTEVEPAVQLAKGGETDKRSPTSISVFLQSVGKAVIEAQGELDKSLTAPDNTNVSAAYRIPKLSAEIAFEVEKADESGVNILLASRSSSERESLKQKVCFDIVAVPLPAELSVRNQLAEIILNRLPEGDPWRERLAGATLLRQARGTLALSLAVQGQDGPSLLVAPDSGDTVKGPLQLEPALGKALVSILAKV